jgi:hypothetical protein
MAQQPSREFASTDPTTRKQNAGFQVPGVSPKISLNSRRHLQHFVWDCFRQAFLFLYSLLLREGISQSAAVETIRGELAIGRVSTRRNLVYGGLSKDPNHDAVMRIGSEAPR